MALSWKSKILSGALLLLSLGCTVQIKNVKPAPSLVFLTPVSSANIAGAPFTQAPVVAIEDSNHQTITTGPDSTAAITLSLISGTGTLSGTLSVNAVDGVADFSNALLSMTSSGLKRIQATKADLTLQNGLASLSVDSDIFTISPTTLSLSLSSMTSPVTSLASGASTTLTLTARDSYGNQFTQGGLIVSASLGASGDSGGTFGTAIDNHNGTYSIVFTATTGGTARSLQAMMNGSLVTSTLPTIRVDPVLSLSPVTVQQGANAVFTASLNTTSTQVVSFNWTTQNGTAIAGTNYTASSGTNVQIAAGQTSVTLTVPTLTVATPDLDVSFALNATAITNTTATSVNSTGRILASTLDLDFTTGTLPAAVSFSRASTGTYFDSSGILQTAAADSPRFDHDPNTFAALGLLLEPASTQLCTNSGASNPDGNGIPDNWSVNVPTNVTVSQTTSASSAFPGFNQLDLNVQNQVSTYSTQSLQVLFGVTPYAISPNSTYTFSVYTETLSGSTANQGERFDVFTYNSSEQIVDAYYPGESFFPSPMGRQSFSFTAGATAVSVRMLIQIDGVIGNGNYVIRVLAPQIEQGLFATSPMLTTDASPTFTRAADLTSLTTLNPWYQQGQGTWDIESIPLGFTSLTALPSFLSGVGANSSTDFYSIFFNPSSSNQINYTSTVNSVSQYLNPSGSVVTPGTLSKTAYAFQPNDANAATAATLGVSATSGSVPNIVQVNLGTDASGQNGYQGDLQHLRYFPARLSDPSLKQLTQ